MNALIVDDQPDVLLVLQLMLKHLGHDVIACTGGQEALAQMESVTPDLILCDLSMPGMDGLSFARSVRANDRFKQPKMLAISALCSDGLHQDASKAGFDGHVQKPVQLDHLKAVLDQLFA